MDLTYKLSGEQIYEKVGGDVELEYPNEAFYSLSRAIIAVTSIFLFVVLLTSSNLHMAVAVLHVDFILIILYLNFLLRKGRGWVNTLLACISTIFVIEEVVRRRQRQELDTPQYSITRRRDYTATQTATQNESNDEPAFLSVDINKLNQALKGGFKNI